MHTAPRVLEPLARRIADVHGTAGLQQRDPTRVAQFLSVVSRLTAYFSPEVRQLDNLPETGPVLVVGNHSCIMYMPDAAVVAQAVAARRGVTRPIYGLAYDLLFTVPVVGRFIRQLGLVPADGESALRALRQDAAVVVFPGGDHDACRPWSERDRIAFGDHRGFVRLALSAGVPVVPVVAHGAHHGLFILARGEPLARLLGLAGVRVHVMPLVLGPLGVLPILAPLPLPAKVTIEFLPPMDWGDLPPESADDPAVVKACYDEIVTAMQGTLDRLAAEIPHPVSSGALSLAGRLVHAGRGQDVPKIPTNDTISPG